MLLPFWCNCSPGRLGSERAQVHATWQAGKRPAGESIGLLEPLLEAVRRELPLERPMQSIVQALGFDSFMVRNVDRPASQP